MPHELRVHIFTSDRRDGEALHVLNLSVANFTRISAIKALLEQRLGVPVGQQVLQYQRRELHNDEALDDSIPQGARIDFSLRMPDLQASGQWGIVSLRSQCPFPPELEEVLVQVALGQDSGRRPELAGNGTGGAYFLSTVDGRRVACFKPQDEEPYAPNNPRGNVAAMGTYSPIQPGIMSGEGCVREVAAYLMDHEGRAGVPPTGLVEAWSRSYSVVAPAPGSGAAAACGGGGSGGSASPAASSPLSPPGGYRPPPRKLGSFQVFVRGGCLERWWTSFRPEVVQNIAALDIRIMNTDRNYENLLQVREAGDGNMWTLIPIDHGYCMPSAMQFMEKEWAKAPAMREPVHADLRAYIARLDVEADITMLRRTLHIREQCLELVRMGSLLLQQGVAAGMTLNDISGWLPGLNTYTREDLEANRNVFMRKCALLDIWNQARQMAAVRMTGGAPRASPILRTLPPPAIRFSSSVSPQASGGGGTPAASPSSALPLSDSDESDSVSDSTSSHRGTGDADALQGLPPTPALAALAAAPPAVPFSALDPHAATPGSGGDVGGGGDPSTRQTSLASTLSLEPPPPSALDTSFGSVPGRSLTGGPGDVSSGTDVQPHRAVTADDRRRFQRSLADAAAIQAARVMSAVEGRTGRRTRRRAVNVTRLLPELDGSLLHAQGMSASVALSMTSDRAVVQSVLRPDAPTPPPALARMPSFGESALPDVAAAGDDLSWEPEKEAVTAAAVSVVWGGFLTTAIVTPAVKHVAFQSGPECEDALAQGLAAAIAAIVGAPVAVDGTPLLPEHVPPGVVGGRMDQFQLARYADAVPPGSALPTHAPESQTQSLFSCLTAALQGPNGEVTLPRESFLAAELAVAQPAASPMLSGASGGPRSPPHLSLGGGGGDSCGSAHGAGPEASPVHQSSAVSLGSGCGGVGAGAGAATTTPRLGPAGDPHASTLRRNIVRGGDPTLQARRQAVFRASIAARRDNRATSLDAAIGIASHLSGDRSDCDSSAEDEAGGGPTSRKSGDRSACLMDFLRAGRARKGRGRRGRSDKPRSKSEAHGYDPHDEDDADGAVEPVPVQELRRRSVRPADVVGGAGVMPPHTLGSSLLQAVPPSSRLLEALVSGASSPPPAPASTSGGASGSTSTVVASTGGGGGDGAQGGELFPKLGSQTAGGGPTHPPAVWTGGRTSPLVTPGSWGGGAMPPRHMGARPAGGAMAGLSLGPAAAAKGGGAPPPSAPSLHRAATFTVWSAARRTPSAPGTTPSAGTMSIQRSETSWSHHPAGALATAAPGRTHVPYVSSERVLGRRGGPAAGTSLGKPGLRRVLSEGSALHRVEGGGGVGAGRSLTGPPGSSVPPIRPPTGGDGPTLMSVAMVPYASPKASEMQQAMADPLAGESLGTGVGQVGAGGGGLPGAEGGGLARVGRLQHTSSAPQPLPPPQASQVDVRVTVVGPVALLGQVWDGDQQTIILNASDYGTLTGSKARHSLEPSSPPATAPPPIPEAGTESERSAPGSGPPTPVKQAPRPAKGAVPAAGKGGPTALSMLRVQQKPGPTRHAATALVRPPASAGKHPMPRPRSLDALAGHRAERTASDRSGGSSSAASHSGPRGDAWVKPLPAGSGGAPPPSTVTLQDSPLAARTGMRVSVPCSGSPRMPGGSTGSAAQAQDPPCSPAASPPPSSPTSTGPGAAAGGGAQGARAGRLAVLDEDAARQLIFQECFVERLRAHVQTWRAEHPEQAARADAQVIPPGVNPPPNPFITLQATEGSAAPAPSSSP